MTPNSPPKFPTPKLGTMESWHALMAQAKADR
jgi:hypothetical protein